MVLVISNYYGICKSVSVHAYNVPPLCIYHTFRTCWSTDLWKQSKFQSVPGLFDRDDFWSTGKFSLHLSPVLAPFCEISMWAHEVNRTEDELEVLNASLKTLYYLLDTCETIACVLITEVHTFRPWDDSRVLRLLPVTMYEVILINLLTECAI